MSSIDKGVEKVVSELHRNVRVERRGNTIVGIMNGEVIFSMADRYGYINEQEKQIIRDGIRRYDEEQRRRKEQAAAERRAREEAIRRAKEEAERRRIEAERQAALRAVREMIAVKRGELNAALARRSATAAGVDEAARTRRNAITAAASACPSLDLSALTAESDRIEKAERDFWSGEQEALRRTLSELAEIDRALTDTASVADCRAASKKCSKIKLPTAASAPASQERGKFLENVTAVRRTVDSMAPVIRRLEGLAVGTDAVAMTAREALSHIKGHPVRTPADLDSLNQMLEGRLAEIIDAVESAAVASETAKLAELQGTLAAVRRLRTVVADSTFSVKDHREEIIAAVEEAQKGFSALAEAEFTSASRTHIESVRARLEEIMAGDSMGESVLHECRSLIEEAVEIQDKDRRLAPAYEEYRALVAELLEYGASAEEIGAFEPSRYAEQKQELLAALRHERREFEKSQLILTDMEARNVMEEMGYELFSSIGDAQGYVREALYTRPGYNGVLWQVITCADGSVKRRIIGVNQGDTQTDIDYIIEVGREMEEEHDAEEFLRRFSEASESKLAVTVAVDHDSEGVEETIRRNGFHYLSGEALALYRKRVQVIRNNTPVAPAERQVRAAAVGTVGSTASALQEECRRQQAANAN